MCQPIMDKDFAKDKDVSVLDLAPSSSASVEGVFVGTLSPVTTGKKNIGVKYCDGQISDGKKTVRFVSFEPKLRPEINLRNCGVKRNREQALEVQANAHTKVINYLKKFKGDEKAIIESQKTKCHQIKALEDLNDIAEHQSVWVTGKVILLFFY